jgi:hypothetical protein
MAFTEQARGRPPFTSSVPHGSGANRISRVEFVFDTAQPPSEPLRYLESRGVVALEGGDGPLVQIELDEGRAGAFADLRPTLPLLIRY